MDNAVMDNMESTLTNGMTTVMMVAVLSLVLQSLIPAPPTPPSPQYECPICSEKFMTYEELYAHFISEHPSEPINIVWE